jgi:hypothetical protein
VLIHFVKSILPCCPFDKEKNIMGKIKTAGETYPGKSRPPTWPSGSPKSTQYYKSSSLDRKEPHRSSNG